MNIREKLVKAGYKEVDSCFWKIIDNYTIYFNLDDEGNFTTISLEVGTHGGNEIILYDEVDDIEDIEEVENSL